MGFPVYDYRADVRNVLVTPQIRSRFMRMDPGPRPAPHSHDLGHEIFLVLEGRAEFVIDGETRELGPGQMCVALADQAHSVRAVGDRPMTMYLSVTPHVQPTHTGRTPEGGRLPHRFQPNRVYDAPEDPETPVEGLIDRHVEAAEALAETARVAAEIQREAAARMKAALARADAGAVAEARKAMWEEILRTYRGIHDLAKRWNELAPRADEGIRP